MNRSRRLILFAAGALACPAAAQAPGRVYRVGMLVNGEPAAIASRWKAFDDQLARSGLVVGRNLELHRLADLGSRLEDVTAKARELVAARCDVIVVEGTGRARILLPIAQSIPVVLAGQADPVGSGFVRNLSKPGGNVTGVSSQECELIRKRFELVRELAPTARRVVLMTSPAAIPCPLTKDALLGADSPIELSVVDVSPAGLEAAHSVLQGALKPRTDVVIPFGVTPQRLPEAIHRTLEARRAPIISDDSWGEGAVISLIHDSDAIGRSCADQVAKILSGAKPGDLPVELVGKFQVIVNRRRAKEIGVAIPESILLRADRIID